MDMTTKSAASARRVSSSLRCRHQLRTCLDKL
jgi:hypothetical protein